jgi:hypothetical protein
MSDGLPVMMVQEQELHYVQEEQQSLAHLQLFLQLLLLLLQENQGRLLQQQQH